MQKLAISDVEIMRLAVQQEISRSDESRYNHRLHGSLLVSQGVSCYQKGYYLDLSNLYRLCLRLCRLEHA